MKLTAAQIAEYLGGVVEGRPEEEVDDFAKIEDGAPGKLSFLSNPKYTHCIYSTRSSIVLVNREFKAERPVSVTLVRVDDAYGALAKLLALVKSKIPRRCGVHPQSVVEPSATIGKDVYIGAFVYVGVGAVVEDGVELYPQVYIGDNVRVGGQSTLYAGVKVYNDCEIGERCIIHAGAVIGADGFGFAPQPDGHYVKIPQMGNVTIGDDVEIGANTTVDRAALGSTRVERGTKLDNLVQVAHNVVVGEDTVIAAQTGISGSTKVGARCNIGGQVGMVGHIDIADDVTIGAQSGIMNSVTKSKVVLMGSPAMPKFNYLKSFAIFCDLPRLASDVDALKRRGGGA